MKRILNFFKKYWIFIIIILVLVIYGYFFIKIFLYPKPSRVDMKEYTPVNYKILPCDESKASKVNLDYPYPEKPPAEFTTKGGDIYIKQRNFPHGGFFNPKVGIGSVYVGLISNPPIWDKINDNISGVFSKAVFEESNYGKLNIPPGRYWLWSRGNGIELISCTPNGLSDPLPRP